MYRIDVITLVLSFLSFILHLIGTIFPYWWVVHEHDIIQMELTFHYGIWNIMDCRNGTCESTSSGMHGARAWLIGPAVLLVMAAVLLCISVVLNGVYLTKSLMNKPYDIFSRRLNVVCSSGAGAIIVLAVLIFYKKKAGLRPSAAPDTTDGSADWTLFMSTCGGIVGIITGVMVGVGINRTFKQSFEKSIFGIKDIDDMEIDVNALRKGELVQGRNVNELQRRDVIVTREGKTIY